MSCVPAPCGTNVGEGERKPGCFHWDHGGALARVGRRSTKHRFVVMCRVAEAFGVARDTLRLWTQCT